MSDINAIIASIGDAIVLANKQSKEELKSYIKSQLDTYKFSGTQIRQNSLPGAAIGRWGVPYTKVSGLQAEVARIAAAEISTATIDYAQINNVRIKTADIDDAAITTAKIGDAAITSAKIGDAEIGTAQIANAAIKTANIDLGAITTALIQEGAVGSVQIADGSITDAKIVELTANKITAGELAVERLVISGTDKSIVYALNNMGDLVSTSVDTIDGDTLTPRTITADKIVAESITSGEIAAEAIITNKIAANAVTADKIAANVITANHISAGAIEADAIDAGAVTTEKLDAESVTAEKIAVGAIKAVHLDAENIFAENAIIRQLMAANIDVDTFFSRDAVINSLTLDRLQPLNDAIEMRFTTEREQTAIHKSTTPPADPVVDKLWLDMGVTPSILRRWTGNGESTDREYAAEHTGSIVQFNDAPAGTGLAVKVEGSFTQEGSGDPSPDNIRPITSWLADGGAMNISIEDGSSIALTAPQEIPSGWIDNSGHGQITWALIQSYANETLPAEWISDRDVYTQGGTPTTGAQVAYQLATPIDITLDPAPLTSINGTNTVSADNGTVIVNYTGTGWDAVNDVSGNLQDIGGAISDANKSIASVEAIQTERLNDVNTALDQLNAALSAAESNITNNATASEWAIGQINAAIAALEAEAESLRNGVSGLEANKVTTDQYIKTGLLYVDDNNIPRYGVAIGENLTTVTDGQGQVVIRREALATTITSDRISFWRYGQEVLYISEDAVYIKKLVMGPWEWNYEHGMTLIYRGAL